MELLACYLRAERDRGNTVGLDEAIHELPLEQWRDVAGSKVKPLDFLCAIWQLARIYRTYRRRADRAPSHETFPDESPATPYRQPLVASRRAAIDMADDNQAEHAEASGERVR